MPVAKLSTEGTDVFRTSFLSTRLLARFIMQLALTRKSDNRVSVELFDDEGEIIYQRILNRFKNEDVMWLARITGEAPLEATRFLYRVCTVSDGNGNYEELQLECDPPRTLIQSLMHKVKNNDVVSSTPFQVTLRDISQPRAYAQSFTNVDPSAAFKEALEGAGDTFTEPLLEWDEINRFCCLDIDYHNIDIKDRLQRKRLNTIVSRIRPQPVYWHPSHRGGAKLYYSEKPGGYTAEELAAVAGLSWVQVDSRATFDLIKATRHPCYGRERDNAPAPLNDVGEVDCTHGDGDFTLIRKLLATELNELEVEELLLERGWSIGQMLPHSECPIDAGNASDESKLSVYIGEHGIHCHRCNARGLGANGTGYLPYSALMGGVDSRITTMVRNFCHIDHAKIVLSNLFPSIGDAVLTLIYRVMLKILHTADDPRITLALQCGRGFVRSRGSWVNETGTTVMQQGIKDYVRSLPAVLVPNDKGYTLNVARTTAFMNGGDLTEHGYPDITFIRGCKVYGQYLHDPKSNEITKVITRREFDTCSPRYLTQSKRMDSSEAWALLDSCYPGIDHRYLKLLICAKGAAEGRLAQCPFLLVTGPAGSGKSTTPHIAAGICGDKADEPVWMPHPERFRAALMDSARETSFVVINEIFKSAEMAKLTHIQALNPMLSLTEDSRSHVLFVGSRPFGRLPVFVLTDVNIPRDVETDIQIARRFTYIRLTQRCYWEDVFTKYGIRPHEYRLISAEHALSADTILSEVIDEFFREPMSLKDIGEILGCTPIESTSDDRDRKKEVMKRFYQEVCMAPALSGSDAQRYSPSGGWKRVDRVAQNPINELWNELCDGQADTTWQQSRACDAEDWAKLLELDFPVVCDIRPYHGSVTYVRFRSTDSPKHPAWINGVEVE